VEAENRRAHEAGMQSALLSRMSTKPLAQQVVTGANGAESANAQDGAVRPRDSLFHWCGTADSLRRTNDRGARCSLLEAYFGAVAEESIAPAARYFLGSVLPAREGRRLGVDPSLIEQAIRDLTHLSTRALRARAREYGDLAAAAADVFAGRLPSGVSIIDVVRWADEMADANDATERRTVLRDMFARLSALEAQYVVRLLGGELQIGVDEALIEEALATAFSQPLDAVRRAAALRGDIGEVAALARRRMLTPLSAAV
jgi:DNA ligase 1